jgi:cell division protein FtsQ
VSRLGNSRRRSPAYRFGAVVFVIFLAAGFAVWGPLVRAEDVRITGGEPDEQLEAIASSLQGKPMLLLSEERIAADVAAIPWVAKAEVSRNFISRRVEIRVSRRIPVAWASIGGNALLLDVEGAAFSVTPSASPGLLEVTGEIEPLALGSRSERVAALVEAASALGRWSKESFISASWSERSGVTLRLASGSQVRVGTATDLEAKGRALRAMQEKASAEGIRVRTYTVVAPAAPALEPV